MNYADLMKRLNDSSDSIRRMGATALYLYGSVVRGEARPDSDVDLFIEYDPATPFNAFDLVGIKLLLEERLGIAVDLTTRDGLHPRLRETIERSALRVF